MAEKHLMGRIDMVKAALAAKGIVYEHNLLIKLLNDEASFFLASKVMQPVNSFIDNCNFEFFNIIGNEGDFSLQFIREKVYFIFRNTFSSSESQIFLKSSCNIFRYSIIDKYVPEIESIDGVIRSGLEKEADYHLSARNWIDFIKTIFLVRPMVFAKMLFRGRESIDAESSNSFSGQDSKEFSPLPPLIIEEAFKSFLCADLFSSRILSELIYIFDMMYRIDPWPGEYTGAEEPHDKSWLTLAMINSEFYGFDKKIIEELFLIAEDKNW